MIYLDYNASTPMDPSVVAAVLEEMERPGNAASVDHGSGARARHVVEEARAEVAELIGAEPDEIIFTSGATESDNIAIAGVLARASVPRVVVSAVEHPAVLEVARQAGNAVFAPVDRRGVIDVDALASLLGEATALVSVMAVNNETGVVQPLDEVGRLCAEHGVALHVDAAQAGGRLQLDVDEVGAALVSLSAHKMYGPKGVGALYVRRRPRVKVSATQWGGGHERGLRPGTLNVPGIVGFGVAARLARTQRRADAEHDTDLRLRLLKGLGESGVVVNVPGDVSLPHTLSARFPDVSARALLHRVNERVAFSTGSACATIKNEPSHVLLAQGLDVQAVAESCRLSFGRFTTEAEVDQAAAVINAAVGELRALVAVT